MGHVVTGHPIYWRKYVDIYQLWKKLCKSVCLSVCHLSQNCKPNLSIFGPPYSKLRVNNSQFLSSKSIKKHQKLFELRNCGNKISVSNVFVVVYPLYSKNIKITNRKLNYICVVKTQYLYLNIGYSENNLRIFVLHLFC